MSSAASVTALAALSLSAVACGATESSADPSPSSHGTIRDAVDETLDTRTASFKLTFEYTRDEATFGIEAGERASLKGAADFRQRELETGRGGRDRVIVDQTTVYVLDGDEPDGRWRRYVRGEKIRGGFVSDWLVGRVDPVRLLEVVPSVEGRAGFARVGEETVGGAPTTRYHGYAEVNAFMRALFPSIAYDKADRPYPPPDEVPIDVWVGDEGWVRKIVYEFPEFDLFAGDLTTMELYDLGADLEIEPPSATEIVNG
jgi:hypothetical protein